MLYRVEVISDDSPSVLQRKINDFISSLELSHKSYTIHYSSAVVFVQYEYREVSEGEKSCSRYCGYFEQYSVKYTGLSWGETEGKGGSWCKLKAKRVPSDSKCCDDFYLFPEVAR